MSMPPRKPDALTARRAVGWLNNWRDSFNPLRGLSVARAVTLLEAYPRGIMADYMWTLFFVEQSDADLLALIARRTSALLEMDWTIKAPDTDKHGRKVDVGLAEAQAAALQEAYDGIDNLYDAVEHLAMATFRGFAHAEKYRNADGDIYHVELVDPWNVVRDGLKGAWKYNPDATAAMFAAVDPSLLMDPQDFLMRDVRRPVGRIALLKFIRQNMSQKDWDAFIEIYGIPSWLIIGPPNVPEGKDEEYAAAARQIADGGGGYLPNGSSAVPADGPRGISPFREHMDFLSEKLILAGTGGLLTMLAKSGTGTLAGDAHTETFEQIARAEARQINEIFQRQFDAEVLEAKFPGRPRLAYFELAFNEETDTDTFIKNVELLGRAGYQVDAAQVEEKSGYKVTLKPNQELPAGTKPEPAAGAKPVTNRATDEDVAAQLQQAALIEYLRGTAADLSPITNRLAEIEAIEDPMTQRAALKSLAADLPQLAREALGGGAAADALLQGISAGWANGVAEAAERRRSKNAQEGPLTHVVRPSRAGTTKASSRAFAGPSRGS